MADDYQNSFGDLPSQTALGAAYGFRRYRIREGELSGVRRFWWRKEMSARCLLGPPSLKETHIAPDERCECGIYGLWSIDNPSSYEAYVFGNMPIITVVKATGKVLIGTKGFRAQNVEISGAALDLQFFTQKPTDSMPWVYSSILRGTYLSDSLNSLLKRHKIPFFDTIDNLVKEFPLSKLEDFMR